MAAGITGLTQTAVAALVPSASEPALESKWHQPFSEPVRQRIAPQLAVALIASGLTYVNAGPFPESVTEGRWHQPWSEPVRVRPALPTTEQHVFEFEPAPIVSIGWYAPLAEPVRLKPGLPAGLQPFLAPDPFPKVSFSWWNWLAEPVRVRPALPAGEQQVSPFDEDVVLVDRWFQPLSEPARVRPAVLVPACEQQFEPFDEGSMRPVAIKEHAEEEHRFLLEVVVGLPKIRNMHGGAARRCHSYKKSRQRPVIRNMRAMHRRAAEEGNLARSVAR